MDDWGKVMVFGVRPNEACVIRPSAYGLVEDDRGRLAVVRTSQGTFLPGGGIEAGETAEKAIKREALEECGLVIRLGTWTARAIQFVYAESERTHFQKRSTFIQGFVDAAGDGFNSVGFESDHELLWVNPEAAIQMLSHQSHCWAVERWRHCSS